MRTHTTPHLGFLVTPPSLPHCLTITQFTDEDTLSQSVEAPVEMVVYAGQRLIPHLTNLDKGVAFIEMQPEDLPLIGAQALDQLPPASPAEQSLAGPVVFQYPGSCKLDAFQFAKFHRPIMWPRAQVNPAAQRLVVTRLYDPGARGSFRRVV